MYPGFLDLIDSALNVNIFDWFYKLLAHMYMFPLSNHAEWCIQYSNRP